MNIPKLVEFVNAGEHLTDVEPRMFFFEDA